MDILLDRNLSKSIEKLLKLDFIPTKINCSVKHIGFNEFDEVLYELKNDPLHLFGENESKIIDIYDIEAIGMLLDDIIYEKLQKKHEQVSLRNYKSKIDKFLTEGKNPEVLFLEINSGLIEIGNKEYALYYLLIKEHKNIKNVLLPETFLKENFDIKYGDLIQYYPHMDKKLVKMIINDKDLNPVILHEYLLKSEELPDIGETLKSGSLTKIEDLYFKLINLEKPQTLKEIMDSNKYTKKMLLDYITRFDCPFIYKSVLSSPYCPDQYLMYHCINEEYQKEAIKNSELSKEVIEFIAYNTESNDVLFSLIRLKNVSSETRNKILSKKNILENIPNSSYREYLLKIKDLIFKSDIEKLSKHVPYDFLEDIIKGRPIITHDVDNTIKKLKFLKDTNCSLTKDELVDLEKTVTLLIENDLKAGLKLISNESGFLSKEVKKDILTNAKSKNIRSEDLLDIDKQLRLVN